MRALRAALLATVALLGCESPPQDTRLFRPAPTGDLTADGSTYGGTILDWDGDDLPDLLLSVHGNRAVLLLNQGGLRFRRAPLDPDLPARQPDMHGSAACDFDRDGDRDVIVTVGADKGYGLGSNQLWRQGPDRWHLYTGPGARLVADPLGRGRAALWADLDGDQGCELLILNYQSEPRLLTWTGGGWADATSWLPWPPPVPLAEGPGTAPLPRERARAAWIHTALAADLDGDRRCDLLVAGRPGWSGLLMGDPAGLADRTEASGLQPALWPLTPNNIGAGDLDNDGDLDLVFCGLVGSRPGQALIWTNESEPGRPVFRPNPALPGERVRPLAVAVADLDDDGRLDLYLVQKDDGTDTPPNRLFAGHGDGTFTETTAAWGGAGPDGGAAESVIAADLDLDGDLDLLTFNGADYQDDPARLRGFVLYENTGGGNRGVTLELLTTRSAPHGLGAVVRLRTAGGIQTRRQRDTLIGVGSCILPVHFGVGRDSGPFTVTVSWPDGQEQTLTLPDAGRAYRITEGRPGAEILPVRSKGR